MREMSGRARLVLAGAVALVLVGAVIGAAMLDEPQRASDERGLVGAPSVGTDAAIESAPAPPSEARGGAPESLPGGGALSQLPERDRVIKRADLTLELKKSGFRAAFDRATAIATEVGGFVATSSSERNDDGVMSGSIALRVPNERFDEARRKLALLGTVKSENVSGEDVGGQIVDIEARLRSLRAQEDSLRTLMSRARTVGEVIQVEQQLGLVRQQIEQLAGEEARLKDQVALSTISAFLAEPGVAVGPEEPPGVLRRALDRAIDGALTVIGGSIIAIGFAIPLSVLAFAVYAIVRVVLRRRAPAEA